MAAKQTTEVATKQASTAVATTNMDMRADAGIGREQMQITDTALPYILLLQALSPQVKKATRIEDAEEGDFFNNVTGELYDGEKGFDFIPCAFQKAWVEWTPRESGGGWVASYPDDAKLAECSRNEMGFDVLPNGNVLIPTYYYYGLIVKETVGFNPCIIALARTAMKKGRKLNSLISGLEISDSQGTFNPPMFSQVYHVTSQPEKNTKGDYFNWEFKFKEVVAEPSAYAFAKGLAESVRNGITSAGKLDTSDVAADVM